MNAHCLSKFEIRRFMAGAIALLIGSIAHGEAPPTPVWTKLVQSLGSDTSNDVVVTDSGEVFLSGDSSGSPFGSPGQIFLARYTTSGDLVWGRQFALQVFEFNSSLAVDGSGGVYVAGTTVEATDLATNADAYVRKYNVNGDVIWTRLFGTAESDGARDVAVGISGSVQVSGYTFGDLAGSLGLDTREAYVRQYDDMGNVNWTRQFATGGAESGVGIATNQMGDIFVTGPTSGNLGGPNLGQADIYLRKYDSGGALSWTRQWGTDVGDFPSDVAVDADGDIYTVGSVSKQLGQAHFGGLDVYITKFDTDGQHLWTRQWGSELSDIAQKVAVDAVGNVYVAGNVINNPQGGPVTESDAFVVKLNPAGVLLWEFQRNEMPIEGASSISIGQDGSIYLAGAQTQNPTRQPFYDAFLTKLQQVPEPSSGAIALMLVLSSYPITRRRQQGG